MVLPAAMPGGAIQLFRCECEIRLRRLTQRMAECLGERDEARVHTRLQHRATARQGSPDILAVIELGEDELGSLAERSGLRRAPVVCPPGDQRLGRLAERTQHGAVWRFARE